MKTLKELYEYARLAEASYSILVDDTNLAEFLHKKNAEPDADPDFSEKQAKDFASHYKFHHQSDLIPDGEYEDTGFSATLFEKKDNNGNPTGEFVLAVRGTEFLSGFFDDLLDADVDILMKGSAINQTVAMYNYYQQLIKPKGQTIREAFLNESQTLPASGIYYDSYLKNIGSENLPDYVRIYRYIDFRQSNRQGLGLQINANTKLQVTGHSLGGHLATAFARIFGDIVTGVGTVNGAGFYEDDTVAGVLNGLAEQNTYFNSSIHSNIYNQQGIEFATNDYLHTQYGARIGMSAEESGHSSKLVTDALAVQSLLDALSSNIVFNNENTAVNFYAHIVDGSWSDDRLALEKTIIALGQMFLGQVWTVDYNNEDGAERKWLYEKLELLYAHPTINKIWNEGQPSEYSIVNLAELSEFQILLMTQDESELGVAVRHAIVNGHSFALYGGDLVYAQTPEVSLTDNSEQYWQDRAYVFSQIISKNLLDLGFVYRNVAFRGVRKEVYYDMNSELFAATYDTNFTGPAKYFLGLDDIQYYIFGDASNNEINGANRNDHLYGMGGADKIYGKEGDDYIEGNLGDDFLYGGKDKDKLLGGQGNDTLEGNDGKDELYGNEGDDILTGGKGSDILQGGDGRDAYLFFEGDGIDTIIDKDGQGFLIRNGLDLTGGDLVEGDDLAYFNESTKTRYIFLGTSLLISFEDSSDLIVVENFSNGDLGITLNDNDPEQPDTSGHFVWNLSEWSSFETVDFVANTGEINNPDFPLGDFPYENSSTITNDSGRSAVMVATSLGSLMQGNDLKERFFGYLGQDWIQAGGGNDWAATDEIYKKVA